MIYSAYNLIFIILTCVFCDNDSKEDSLKLVHVIFRHGDRTVERATMYPKDPYINETYAPYGLGELTKKGKLHEYKLGQALRKRFDKFLGQTYEPQMVYPLTSDKSRTKMSLLLVLAGLFPPNDDQVIDPELRWQPITYSYSPLQLDKIFFGILCPNYQTFRDPFHSEEGKNESEENRKLFDYLSENSGLNITQPADIFPLYDCLKTQQEFGLKLPDWAKEVYPGLESLAVGPFYKKLWGHNYYLKKLSSGYMLQKIIEDTRAMISQERKLAGRKLYLYSGHEFNVALLMLAFGSFDEKVPPYGSYILVEVHYIDQQYGIKLFYQNYEEDEPKSLILPSCTLFCPFQKFVSILEELMPSEASCGNEYQQIDENWASIFKNK